jgi:hypothetical protein
VLLGAPGDGKSLTMTRAMKTIMPSLDNVMSTTPGSDKGLYRMFSDGGKKGELPSLKPWCLVLDEMRDMQAKIGIQGSSLGQAICMLWSRDEAGSADKSGHYRVNIRLSILGAIALNDPSEFPEVFGASSQGGQYDRCLFAPGPSTAWKFDHRWQPARRGGEHARTCTNVKVPHFVYDILDEWREAAPVGTVRKRLGEMALRVALISAGANHDSVISRECMAAALRFCEWQERVRQGIQGGHRRDAGGPLHGRHPRCAGGSRYRRGHQPAELGESVTAAA